MRKRKQVVLIGFIGLLLMMSFPVEVVSSTLDWSDDFDDGTYDGWTIVSGDYTATSTKLYVTAYGEGDAMPGIEHPSNVTFGTWSFDVKIMLSVDPLIAQVWILKHTSGLFSGAFFGIEFYSGQMTWSKNNGLSQEIQGTFSVYLIGLHHIRVERNTTNDFYVYHNDTLVIEAFSIVPDEDWSLLSFGGTIGACIDNIVVTEFVEPTTTDPTTSEPTTTDPTTTDPGQPEPLDTTMILIIAGGGVAVVVVIAIVVKMRS